MCFFLKLEKVKSYISNSFFFLTHSNTICSDIQVQHKCGLDMGHGPMAALQFPGSIL